MSLFTSGDQISGELVIGIGSGSAAACAAASVIIMISYPIAFGDRNTYYHSALTLQHHNLPREDEHVHPAHLCVGGSVACRHCLLSHLCI